MSCTHTMPRVNAMFSAAWNAYRMDKYNEIRHAFNTMSGSVCVNMHVQGLANQVFLFSVGDCICLACRSKLGGYTKVKNQYEELAVQAEMKHEATYKSELEKHVSSMGGVLKMLRRLELKFKMEKDCPLHV